MRFSILLCLGLMAAASAIAAPRTHLARQDSGGTAEVLVAPARAVLFATAGVSMDQAVKMAEQRFKARVVRAESQQDNGRTVYVLRLLNESGRVWTVRVDASTGSLL